jgi:hypothetical protein
MVPQATKMHAVDLYYHMSGTRAIYIINNVNLVSLKLHIYSAGLPPKWVCDAVLGDFSTLILLIMLRMNALLTCWNIIINTANSMNEIKRLTSTLYVLSNWLGVSTILSDSSPKSIS